MQFLCLLIMDIWLESQMIVYFIHLFQALQWTKINKRMKNLASVFIKFLTKTKNYFSSPFCFEYTTCSFCFSNICPLIIDRGLKFEIICRFTSNVVKRRIVYTLYFKVLNKTFGFFKISTFFFTLLTFESTTKEGFWK